MDETMVPWTKEPVSLGECYLDEVRWDYRGFSILLGDGGLSKGPDFGLVVSHDGMIPFMRFFDEDVLLDGDMGLFDGCDKEALKRHTLFEVRQSRLVEQLGKNMLGFIKPEELFHLRIVCIDTVADIVSWGEPEVRKVAGDWSFRKEDLPQGKNSL